MIDLLWWEMMNLYANKDNFDLMAKDMNILFKGAM